MMSVLLRKLKPHISDYIDKRFPGPKSEFNRQLNISTVAYVGNLSFYTTEEQIIALFSRAGKIKEVVMGLDKYKKTPCGFCFIIYYSRDSLDLCVRFLNGLVLDGRLIRVDYDWGGDIQKRRFGRGITGGQVRDEYREDFDAERGGWGRKTQNRIENMEKKRKTDGDATDAQPEAKNDEIEVKDENQIDISQVLDAECDEKGDEKRRKLSKPDEETETEIKKTSNDRLI